MKGVIKLDIALMDQYSDEEFANIVKESRSYKECLQNLGYFSNSGNSTSKLKEKIQKLNLSTEHFLSSSPRKLDTDIIFCDNSTVDQKTVRRWYKKGNYTPYLCSICGQEPMWQGKELTLILDHIDGHNHNNELINLRWVCPNCNQQLDTTNGKNKIRKDKKPVNTCVDCGIPISRGSVRCKNCDNKYKKEHNIPPVTREELKNLIRTISFVQIGNKYGVSDNAVRKWCIKYNLPSKAREIKNISNKDWEQI